MMPSLHGLATAAITGLMLFAAGSSRAADKNTDAVIDGDDAEGVTADAQAIARRIPVQDIPHTAFHKPRIRDGARLLITKANPPEGEPPEKEPANEASNKDAPNEIDTK